MNYYYLKDISKKYGDLSVLNSINMEIKCNCITTIMGPSGCGKTTLLRIIAGLVKYDDGELVNLKDRKISYLFQEPRLLPWKTVYGNIEFVLQGLQMSDRESIIKKYLELVGLWEFRGYYPKELSGGMKQRVSMARAFAYQSDILLMDEPFKSLDHEMKINLINSFKTLWKANKPTVIFVTHDEEARDILGGELYNLDDINNK